MVKLCDLILVQFGILIQDLGKGNHIYMCEMSTTFQKHTHCIILCHHFFKSTSHDTSDRRIDKPITVFKCQQVIIKFNVGFYNSTYCYNSHKHNQRHGRPCLRSYCNICWAACGKILGTCMFDLMSAIINETSMTSNGIK